MMKEANKGIRENLESIKVLKRELMLRLALLGHARGIDPNLEMLAALKSINAELETAYREVRECEAHSPMEEEALTHIRLLEDQRFELLSKMNGNHLGGYAR